MAWKVLKADYDRCMRSRGRAIVESQTERMELYVTELENKCFLLKWVEANQRQHKVM